MTKAKNNSPKAYESHENAYQNMRKKGQLNWNDIQQTVPPPANDGIDDNDRRFIDDALAQPWAPSTGLAVELGCGTAPMLRWLCSLGFTGLGLEISATAVEMGREQSSDYDLTLRKEDVCSDNLKIDQNADLVLDGHCLHCITDPADRRTFLANARRIIKPQGLFIVLSMCSPVNRKRFTELYAPQKLVGKIIYSPSEVDYPDCKIFSGKRYLPTRYFGHWKDILREIKAARFDPRLIRIANHWKDDINSDIAVAAVAI